MKKILLGLILIQATPLVVADWQYTPPLLPNNFDENIKKRVKQLEDEKREKQRRLDESNVFTDDDRNQIIDEKIQDLKSINAILIRFKEDFRKVREQDDQDGRYTKTKVDKIFKTELWQYIPNKDFRVLVNKLHRDFHYSEIPRSQKLSELRTKITNLKKQLIYLRDFCTRKEKSPWQVFVYLYHTDIRLAVHKHNKDWEEYVQVLKELDQGLN